MEAEIQCDGEPAPPSQRHKLNNGNNSDGLFSMKNILSGNLTDTEKSMSSLSDRMMSFSSLPDIDDFPYRTIDLARNGFYCGMSVLRVSLVCFACQFSCDTKDVLRDPSLLITRHRQHSLKCEYVVMNGLKSPASVNSDTDSESVRAASFPSFLSGQSSNLLDSGLSSQTINSADTVRSKHDGNLSSAGAAVASRVDGPTGPTRLNPPDISKAGTKLTTVPYVARPVAINQEYETYENRLASYSDFPASSPMDPQELARAGFYYTHYGDKTKCPYCNGSVYNWEPQDTGFGEHRRHYPQCDFLKYLTYEILSTPVPSIDPAERIPVISADKRSQDAVIDIGYPLELVLKVIAVLKRRKVEVCTDTILDDIFEREQTQGCLISMEPSYVEESDGDMGALEGAVGGLNLNEHNHALTLGSDIDDDIYAPNDDSGNFDEVASASSDAGVSSSNSNVQLQPRSNATGGARAPVATLAPAVPTPAPVKKDMSPEVLKVEQEYQRLRKSNICNQCREKPVNTLFLPCRHLVTCEECAEKSEECLHCGEDIIGTVKVFLP